MQFITKQKGGQEMLVLGKKFNFDYAHFLPEYEGKCVRIHGHTGTLFVEIEGEINPKTGMIMDYKRLTEIVNKILDNIDHYLLNPIITPGPPTCENTIIWIKEKLEDDITRNHPGCKLHRLELHEGLGGYCVWKKTL